MCCSHRVLVNPVNPARAGMILVSVCGPVAQVSKPRASGDDPCQAHSRILQLG